MRISDWSSDVCSSDLARKGQIMTDTHVTAPTQFVEVDGVRYAYRRYGAESGTPLLFFQHFRGGLDNWDPLVTDGLAQGRSVILFNYAGVASSTGENATTVDGMADGGAAFVKALDLDPRSEEHTSELQSLMRISYAVFCLKKKKTQDSPQQHDQITKTHQHQLTRQHSNSLLHLSRN